EEALMLNVLRRPIGPVLWAQAFTRLAELRGIRLGGGGDRRSADAGVAGRADELAAEFGLSPRTARRRLRLAAELEQHPDLSDAVDSLELSQKDARAEVRRRSLARAREQAERAGATARLPRAVDLRVGDFAERLAELEPESVDLIYTDPPYLAALDLEKIYGELGRQAARLLKPGGSLLAYSGCYVLPRTIAALGKSLDYWWMLAIKHAPGLHP